MKESKIEKYLVDQVKALGGKAIKMIPTYENGIPDRLVLLYGKSYFIELKKEGENPDPLQVAYMNELERMGFRCFVIDNKPDIDIFLRLAKERFSEEVAKTFKDSTRAMLFASEYPPTLCKTAKDGVHDLRLRKSPGVYVNYCIFCGRHFA
jgi:hypothetical protein